MRVFVSVAGAAVCLGDRPCVVVSIHFFKNIIYFLFTTSVGLYGAFWSIPPLDCMHGIAVLCCGACNFIKVSCDRRS